MFEYIIITIVVLAVVGAVSVLPINDQQINE